MVLLNIEDPLVVLCDGHGMNTSGKRTPIFPAGSGLKSETGNFMHENEFNRAVVKYLDQELKRCGIRTLLVAPTDADTPLMDRVRKANAAGADLYISVHANAMNGKWGNAKGIETLCAQNTKSKAIAGVIHKHILQGTKLPDRGLKDGSWLAIVKYTKMPAVLIEAGFMDNLEEAKLLLTDAYRRETARELAQGICEVFGKKYIAGNSAVNKKPAASSDVDTSKGIGTIRVSVPSLNLRKEADFNSAVIRELKEGEMYYVYAEKNGLYDLGGGWTSAHTKYVAYTPHPKPKPEPKPSGDLYKVQTGAFREKENAEKLAETLEAKGFDTMIVKK